MIENSNDYGSSATREIAQFRRSRLKYHRTVNRGPDMLVNECDDRNSKAAQAIPNGSAFAPRSIQNDAACEFMNHISI